MTVIGLHDEGFTTREASERQAVDLVLLYAVFFGLILIDGIVLAVTEVETRRSPSPRRWWPQQPSRSLWPWRACPTDSSGRFRERWGRRGAALAAFPAVIAEGVRGSAKLIRANDPAVLGALIWWLLDVAARACLAAFGASIGVLQLLMAHLVGHILNVLPVPGGVGPVEGGIIGALVAFGEPAGLALVATLGYQLISVWLPAVPGAYALWRVRRHHSQVTAVT